MKDKNSTQVRDPFMERVMEQNRKAAEIALKNIIERSKFENIVLPICVK